MQLVATAAGGNSPSVSGDRTAAGGEGVVPVGAGTLGGGDGTAADVDCCAFCDLVSINPKSVEIGRKKVFLICNKFLFSRLNHH